MAAVTASDLVFRAEWEPAEGVAAPELAATWCRLELTLGEQTVTTVEDRRTASVRRGVYTSAYPLAEWVAEHWWQLRGHLRPSTVPRALWTWRGIGLRPWLRAHNLRAAGSGMPWPDLTLVPEGSLTRVVWFSSGEDDTTPLRYLTSGDVYVPSDQVIDALSRFVDLVSGRLYERGITGTRLQQEWQLLRSTDAEEGAFSAAAARLGLDPYDVDETLADDIVALADVLEPELLAELLDSAHLDGLRAARAWIEHARAVAMLLPRAPLPSVYRADRDREGLPWTAGYDAARAYRAQLGLDPQQRMVVKQLVGTATTARRPSGGLQGMVVAPGDHRVGLVLPGDRTPGATSLRFAQARALGASLLSERTVMLLDPTATDFARTVRAFAAELLAPAEGIGTYLKKAETTTAAFEALATHYGVSPLLVQHQYDNQLVDLGR